jgi:Zn-dependent protease
MPQKMKGSIRLFGVLGIQVSLHWSWFLVALYEIQSRAGRYNSILWNVLEYFALFLIVLLHEFGHALACRRVGGQADQIVLWPLGGIAYVAPPQRPGAMLWSISAGPLVNIAIFPVLSGILLAGWLAGWQVWLPNAADFFLILWFMNLSILIFNLLPIYPLDGGQILRSLLWFKYGRVKSLMITAIIGFVGVGGMLLVALWAKSAWFGILAVFVLANCWRALASARSWAHRSKALRREGFACPNCRTTALKGVFWTCTNCHNPFDPFVMDGSCLHCGAKFLKTNCPECNLISSLTAWRAPVPAADNRFLDMPKDT